MLLLRQPMLLGLSREDGKDAIKIAYFRVAAAAEPRRSQRAALQVRRDFQEPHYRLP